MSSREWLRDFVWHRTDKIEGENPRFRRKDEFGNLIDWNSYGTDDEYGWEVARRKTESKDGTDGLDNLRALHWISKWEEGDTYPYGDMIHYPTVQGHTSNTPHDKLPATINPASYWEVDKEQLVLIESMLTEEDEINFGYMASQPLVYLRIWPTSKAIQELSDEELKPNQRTLVQPLINRTYGYMHENNRYGVITHSRNAQSNLVCSTQLFKNFEIWGVNQYVLDRNSHSMRKEKEFEFVPMHLFERGMYRSLLIYLKAAERFGYGDSVGVEAGMINVRDFMLCISENTFRGPIIDNNISVEGELDQSDQNSIYTFLLGLFEKIFAVAKESRPPNLHGFPPK